MAEILIISAEMPYPFRGGDQIRQYNLIKRIAEHHNVHLATFTHGKDEEEIGIPEMQKYCKGVHTVPAPKFSAYELMGRFISNLARLRPLCESYHFVPILEEKVQELISKHHFDIIQTEHVYMSEYAHCAPQSSNAKKVLTLIDIESVRIRRQFFLEPLGQNKIRYLIDWLVMKSFEPRAMRRMDKCIAMSEVEAKIARKMAAGVSIEVVPNGVDSKLYMPVIPSKNKELLMIGSLCYPPNIDAAEYFV
ncbi:MAG: glycosyltransferase, partial [Armatimonadota bacterium]|nr:glycosyltransferase [Armatimonadota bacterium]